ncbi:MAG: SRPBCC family protein [Kofleriaceae bacterium]
MAARESSESAPQNQTTMELDPDRSILISRTFNGPARIVFDAWTNPELVKRWWAPKSRGVSVVSIDADVRVGGTYRYVIRPPEGEQVAFSGAYTEITPHSRLVYTQRFEPFPDEVIITVTFEERGGKTHMMSRELYPSKEVREMVIASGMEHGMRETMDLLDELVASLR